MKQWERVSKIASGELQPYKENPIKNNLPTHKEYVRAYKEWYCITAKNPVSLPQYVHVMERLPQSIKQINQFLDEGRKPI